MAKIPPQSEPVDYKDLYKRLEVVAKQRAARNRSSHDSRSLQSGKPTRHNHDSTSSSTTIEKSPPPPTAQATRPVSSMPPPPYNNRLSRLSLAGAPSNDHKRFSVRSDFASPRTSESNDKRTSKRFSKTSEVLSQTKEQDALRSTYTQPTVEHGEMSLKAKRTSLAAITGSIAEDSPTVKRGSMRQVQVVNRPVHKVDQHDSHEMAAPISSLPEELVLPMFESQPEHFAFDATEACLSDISTATTEVAAHSTSSSRSDRKSWNPRGYTQRQKEVPLETEEIIAVPILPNPLVSSVPPLHEFTFSQISPSEEATVGPLPDVASWEKPIPRPQATTTTFEPFRFHDYSFSGASDMSSHRASDTHAFFFSDLDSGVGLSDNGSAAGAEEMPTLMTGAERRPDWNPSDSNLAAKRDSQFGIPQTISDSPVRRPYRESTLRREVSMQEAFDFHPDLALEEEPPEDEGIVVTFDSEALTPVSFEPKHTDALVDTSAVEPDEFTKPDKVKRRTFDPRQLFVAPKMFSQKRTSTLMTTGKQNRMSMAERFETRPTSSKTTRPPSRSQPIVIMPHHQILPQSRSLQLGSSTIPMQSLPSLPSTNTSSQPAASTLSRPRTATHIPIVPKIPAVPAYELAHMTPESLALLREQERVLVRRSTLSMSPADQEAFRQANTNLNMIGVAISSDATFMRPPVPPIPTTIPNPRATLTTQPSMEFNNSPLMPADEQDASSMSTSKPGRIRRLPPAAKSMLELHNASQAAAAIEHSSVNGQKKKKWWKVWHRS